MPVCLILSVETARQAPSSSSAQIGASGAVSTVYISQGYNIDKAVLVQSCQSEEAVVKS